VAPKTTNPAAVANISSVRLVPASVRILWYVLPVYRPVRILSTPHSGTLLTPYEHWIGPQGADPYFTLAFGLCVDCASLNEDMP
jgi:hypothetical protein